MKIMHSFVINKCTRIHLLLRFLIILHPLVSGVPICFFPADIQGKYLTQIEILENPSQVQYSSVNVTPTTISPWGDCYKRIGNNIILIDRNGCFRCVNMALRSINILVFHKSDKIDVCYNSTERAESSCLQNGYDTFRFNEIIIYRQDIIEEYCPIVGKFSLDMHKERLMEDGYGKDAGCLSNRFSVDSCPRASQLNIQLKECSSQNTDITFKCLGSWRKSNNENFLALFDTRNTLKQHPAYRCALYREETGTGIIHVALSSDSTCRSNLTNATYGSETFTLQARTPNVRLKQFQDHCSFPEWLQGHWQNVIVSERSFIYEDHTNFITYSLQCIQLEQSISNEDYKFILYGTTHCEEEVFTCVWIKKRATNVFEFNLSRMGSGHLNKSLCSQEEFSDIWITQGKLNTMEESSCPITGVFVGYIPETGDLCAKLSSNCTSPEIMRYEVITCKDELSLEEQEKMRKNRIIREITKSGNILSNTVPSLTLNESSDYVKNETNVTDFPWLPDESTSQSPITVQTILTADINNIPKEQIPIHLDTVNASSIGPDGSVSQNNDSHIKRMLNVTTTFTNNFDLVSTEKLNNFSKENYENKVRNSSSTDNNVRTSETQYPSHPFITTSSNPIINDQSNTRGYKQYYRYSSPANPTTYDSLLKPSTFPIHNEHINNNNYELNPGPMNTYQNEQRYQSNRYDSRPQWNRNTNSFRPFEYPNYQTAGQYNGGQFNHDQLRRTSWNNNNFDSNVIRVSSNPNQKNWNNVSNNWGVQAAGNRIYVVDPLDSIRKSGQKIPIALPPIQLPPLPITGRTLMNTLPNNNRRTSYNDNKLEGREYHCLGQWKEGNTIYTYTKRKDIANKYECFAGLAEANKILIYEAGDNICSRLPPIIPKMALYKQESCPKNEPVTIYNERYSVIPYQRNATVRSVTKRPPLTQPPLKTKRPTVHKKLQKPFVKPANQNNSSLSTRIRSCFYIFLMSFFITYF